MYIAFWLNPAAQDANKRVVFCQPITKKPTTAWAILRSAVRENRTGGIIAGGPEELQKCIDAIEHKDQGFPDDADRMVAAITKLAEQCDCHVVFRQNVEPDAVSTESSVWSGLNVGRPSLEHENDVRAVVRMSLVGSVDAAFGSAAAHGWAVDESGASKTVGGLKMTIRRWSELPTRATLDVEYPVTAAGMTKQNSAGLSQEVRFPFDKFDDILDTMLGPAARRHKFVLLVKERTNSILFFGTKPANTLRQAIEQYVDHMNDRPSSKEPWSSTPIKKDSKDSKSSEPESDSDLFDEIVAPPIQNCRFWKL